MYKIIYDHSAEITQAFIKARGEAINGEKELIETYLQPLNYCQPGVVYRNSLDAF